MTASEERAMGTLMGVIVLWLARADKGQIEDGEEFLDEGRALYENLVAKYKKGD